MTAVRRAPVGMVGGGQLARMTHQAAISLGIDLRILGTMEGESAIRVARDVALGDPGTRGVLEAFARECDVVTFDHEVIDPDLLQGLEDRGHTLRPRPGAFRYAQDKAAQRQHLADLGLPVPPHARVGGVDDLAAFAVDHGWPLVVKAVRGGYDGRGVWVVADEGQARQVVEDTAGAGVPLMVEAHVPITTEVAVLVARRPRGDAVVYPVAETVQVSGILTELVVPARIDGPTAAEAARLGRRIAEALDVTGVMAVELFVTADGLVVNELAMRPHNSGHWTIEGASTSQFANHLRAVLDWPLGDARMTAPAAATVNLLGPADGTDPCDLLGSVDAVPGTHVHLYGKQARPGRKIGHVTALGADLDDTRARAWHQARLLGTGAPA